MCIRNCRHGAWATSFVNDEAANRKKEWNPISLSGRKRQRVKKKAGRCLYSKDIAG